MGRPITTKSQSVCFAFPNVCFTPPTSPVNPMGIPIPYPSVGQLAEATGTAASVLAGGKEVVTKASRIASTTGDAAGSLKGVTSGTVGGEVKFTGFSGTVFAEGAEVVRLLDTTKQNGRNVGGVFVGNANGVVLGGFPRVLVGD